MCVLGQAYSSVKIYSTMQPKLTQYRGNWRHTSSDDKYDLKKVVTTRFYSANGSKIATCHAHGDGTWNILFTLVGKAQLSKIKFSPTMNANLEVTVLQRIDERGRVLHYGEMINKPDVCRRPISENNDELHRLKQAELEEMSMRGFTELFPRKIQPTGEVPTASGGDHGGPETQTSSNTPVSRSDVRKGWQSRYGGEDDLLTPEQDEIAAGLSKEELTGKEQRSLFQKMKGMPLDQQELILQRSKVLKLGAEHKR
jgi:hypothetical protein